MRQQLIELRSLLNEAAHAYYMLDALQMKAVNVREDDTLRRG